MKHLLMFPFLSFCGIFYLVIDGTQAEDKYHISETLGQAICHQVKEASATPGQSYPALQLENFPHLTKSKPCVRWQWNKCGGSPGCTNFQKVKCECEKKKPKIGVRKHTAKRKMPGKTQKMIGGLETTHEEYPFVVQLRWEPIAPGRARAKCSGSVLNERWILTSAQCCIIAMRRRNGNPTHSRGIITFGQPFPEINCGSKDKKDENWDDAQYIRVESVEVPGEALIDIDKGHVGDPNYDIGMIKADKVLDLKPVELTDDTGNCAQGKAELLGWGKGAAWQRDQYNPAKIIWPNNLRKLEVKALSDQRCERALEFHSNFNSTFRLCGKSTTKGAETCNSDCGGPMMKIKGMAPEASSEESGRQKRQAPGMVQCAIISRPACENGKRSGRPDVLTKVHPHLEWINKVLTW